MSLRLRAAVQGDLRAHMAAEIAAAGVAVAESVRTETRGLQADLRGQTVAGGLGPRMARAWGMRFYRNRGIDAAGLVHARGPSAARAFEAFDRGTVIRSQSGLWLAIPTREAPKRGVGNTRISPATFPEHRFGPLRFVYRRGKPALLVVDGLRASKSRKTGEHRGFRRARRGGGNTTVVMFVLVPQVRLRKRIDIDSAVVRANRRLAERVVRAWEREAVRRRVA